MRWMLLLAFVATVPAFVLLVARWPARDERRPHRRPGRLRGRGGERAARTRPSTARLRA